MPIAWKIAICALIVSMPAAAEPYSYEIEAGYSDSDDLIAETKQTSIQGTYYFDPVTTNDAPVGEAAFASRSSSVSVQLGRGRTSTVAPTGSFTGPLPLSLPLPSVPVTGQPVSDPAFFVAASVPDTDQDDYGATVRYVHESGWLAEASVAAVSSDTDLPGASIDNDGDFYSVAVGKYFAATTTVTIGYQSQETGTGTTAQLFSFCTIPPCPTPPTFTTRSDESADAWSARARHLVKHGARHHVVSGGVSYEVRSRDSSAFTTADTPIEPIPSLSTETYRLESSIGYTYYPLTTVGVGLSLRHINAEDFTTNGRSFFVEWFVNNSFAVTARYRDDEQPISLLDVESWAIGIMGRF